MVKHEVENISTNAKEIYDYMTLKLAEGVNIDDESKTEMLNEVQFMIDTN